MSDHLSDNARHLLESAQGCDDPTAEDRARVKRAVMLAVAGGAVTGSAAAAAAGASSSAAAGAGVVAGAGAAVGTGAAVTGGAAASVGVAGGLVVKVVSTVLVVAAVGGGSASVYQMLNEPAPAQEAPAMEEQPPAEI